jgi:hypothetical protein
MVEVEVTFKGSRVVGGAGALRLQLLGDLAAIRVTAVDTRRALGAAQ